MFNLFLFKLVQVQYLLKLNFITKKNRTLLKLFSTFLILIKSFSKENSSTELRSAITPDLHNKQQREASRFHQAPACSALLFHLTGASCSPRARLPVNLKGRIRRKKRALRRLSPLAGYKGRTGAEPCGNGR